MISIIGATHPGQREHNEDCYAADSELGLGLVADGMGGYACGEVASDIVRKTIEEAAANNEGLIEAIARAHSEVKAAAADDPSKKGMGSTAVAVKMQGLDYEIAWVGDSRAYLWDGSSALKQLSRDHSYVESLLSTGAISYEEAINHPNRNLITQAVGVAGEGGLEIGSIRGRLAPGEQLILCSDGLVDEVLDYDIARLLAQSESPEDALTSLVRAAVVAGGHDNITVVIATAAANTDSHELPIEPEIVRLTTLDMEPEQPTQPRPSPSADITRMGGADFLEDDDDDNEGLGQRIADFVELNLPMVIAGLSVIVLVVAGYLYYF